MLKSINLFTLDSPLASVLPEKMFLQLIKILTLIIFVRHLTLCHLADVHASRITPKRKANQTNDETTDESTKIQQLIKDGVSLCNNNSHDS